MYALSDLDQDLTPQEPSEGGTEGQALAREFAALRDQVSRSILGQANLIERLLIALLADGHLLVEGAPGLAKTTAVKQLAAGLEGDFHRIQFTPDLLPADLTGTEIYRPNDGSFRFDRGPIFHNLLLADEVNRAPAKVQSALLEAMGERQVTVGRETYPLPRLFLVMATQNPIEQEGTYPLPEAQLDRFAVELAMGYPQPEQELEILAGLNAPPSCRPPTRTRSPPRGRCAGTSGTARARGAPRPSSSPPG
jgi:MoxR-like ATPase